jgi:hypothetical protein
MGRGAEVEYGRRGMREQWRARRGRNEGIMEMGYEGGMERGYEGGMERG